MVSQIYCYPNLLGFGKYLRRWGILAGTRLTQASPSKQVVATLSGTVGIRAFYSTVSLGSSTDFEHSLEGRGFSVQGEAEFKGILHLMIAL